jgi:hypothetical protein
MAKRAARLSGRRGEGGFAAHVAALPLPAAAAFASPAEVAASLERNLQRTRALQAAHRKEGSAAFVARVRAAVAAGGGSGGGGGGDAPPQPPLPPPPAAPPPLRRSAVQDNLPERFGAPLPLLAPAAAKPAGPLLVVPLSPSKAARRLRGGAENEGAAAPAPSQKQPAAAQAQAPPKGVVARLRSMMGW